MKELIARFCDRITTSQAPSIPYRLIVLTTRIMDEILAQVYGTKACVAEGDNRLFR